MPVQTFEAITDDDGNVQLANLVRLPARTKVYVIVPEQTTSYAQIVPETDALSLAMMRFPHVRGIEEGLSKRLVKTVVEEAHAEL